MTATALAWCLSLSRIPQMLGPMIVATIGDPLLFLLAVNVALLLVGMVMEAIAAMLVLVPILVPAAAGFGIEPVHFGLIFVLNLMIGTITPPVGIVLFVTARVAGLPFDRLSRAILPWLAPLVVVLLAVTLHPPLATWLPRLVLG
jgi:TRAP-type C4-dicarboxylate transport system permease large subunit